MKKNIKFLKCLGEETRYLIIRELLSKERCACKLPKLIGRTQSNTSMHLRKLVEAGILKRRREGKKIIYSIKDERVRKIFRALNDKGGR